MLSFKGGGELSLKSHLASALKQVVLIIPQTIPSRDLSRQFLRMQMVMSWFYISWARSYIWYLKTESTILHDSCK